MAIRPILQLGHPLLEQVTTEVRGDEISVVLQTIEDLHDTMMDFRRTYGVGRAIAAPQIGVMKRVVYMHIDEPTVFINPVLDQLSADMITLWDDCMSFPELLVRLSRHNSCRISYRDLHWEEKEMNLEGDLSELLQHECDHLDGILAVSRAIDGRSFAYRSELAKRS